MMQNNQNKTSGLLQLGFIVALGTTLSGFEYASADIRTGKITTTKIESLEMELVYEDIEIKKPEVPKEIRNNNANPKPTPQPFVGEIIPSPDPQPDPGFDPFPEPNPDPIPFGFGQQEIVNDEPIDVGFLSEFPTYLEFKEIKNSEERRIKTESHIKNYILSNATFPRIPLELGIEGKVYVSFIVNKKGEISDVKIAKGLHPDLDKEAVKAVSKLPTMIPGKQLDKPVNARYIIPVNFTITK